MMLYVVFHNSSLNMGILE